MTSFRNGTARPLMRAVSPEPRAISSVWPSRPKPVTSVMACTPGSRASSGPGRLSRVVASIIVA